MKFDLQRKQIYQKLCATGLHRFGEDTLLVLAPEQFQKHLVVDQVYFHVGNALHFIARADA